MKKILLLAMPLMAVCFASCEKDNGNNEEVWIDDSPIIQFKDPYFQQALLDENTCYIRDDFGILPYDIDRNGDSQISEKEASIVEFLKVFSRGIRGLEEIKYFTALTDLNCVDNQLTSLDVSKNTALTGLACSYNQLTSLDVSKNTALTDLNCNNNQLTSLDVSKNTALTDLYCSDNQLTSLDLSKNTALTGLSCENNPLTRIVLYKYHMLDDYVIPSITNEYGDIIEYVE